MQIKLVRFYPLLGHIPKGRMFALKIIGGSCQTIADRMMRNITSVPLGGPAPNIYRTVRLIYDHDQ